MIDCEIDDMMKEEDGGWRFRKVIRVGFVRGRREVVGVVGGNG